MQFTAFERAGVKPEGIEAMYKKAHDAIRANPMRKAAAKKAVPAGRKNYHTKKTTKKEKKEAAKKKVATLRQRLGK